jgi:DNA modification methylase
VPTDHGFRRNDDFRSHKLSVPEPQKKWKTELGQIWEIGQHRLMCGDSASASDVAALMHGKTAKLCATGPPYLVSYDAKNHPSKNFSDGKNKDWKGRYADK